MNELWCLSNTKLMDPQKLLAEAVTNPERALRVLDAIESRTSLVTFMRLLWPVLEPTRPLVTGWALEALCEHLQAVSAGQITRLLINVPPGCTKSLTTNVFWPAWLWGPQDRPSTRFIGASYADQLSIRDNGKCRRLLASAEFQEFWGTNFTMLGDQNEKVKFENDKTGWKLATSVGGVGTGERSDVFVVDDPHNIKEGESTAKREAALQWFTEVVPTRLNDTKSAIVIIMQRLHERDVSGLILASELSGDYDHLCLPMRFESKHPHKTHTVLGFHDPRKEDGELLWPERFPLEEVDRTERAMSSWGGSYAVAGQMQQRPAPRGGGMFKRDDWQYVDTLPCRMASTVRGWDLAGTDREERADAAYTVGAKMARGVDGRFYILDVRRKQASAAGVERMLLTAAESDGVSVPQDLPQDPGQAGKSQKAALARLLAGFVVRFSLESGSKEQRARPLAAQVESGNVYLVRGPWNDAFVAECESFPMGAYKDQVDAVSRAFARLLTMRDGGGPGAAPVLIQG